MKAKDSSLRFLDAQLRTGQRCCCSATKLRARFLESLSARARLRCACLLALPFLSSSDLFFSRNVHLFLASFPLLSPLARPLSNVLCLLLRVHFFFSTMTFLPSFRPSLLSAACFCPADPCCAPCCPFVPFLHRSQQHVRGRGTGGGAELYRCRECGPSRGLRRCMVSRSSQFIPPSVASYYYFYLPLRRSSRLAQTLVSFSSGFLVLFPIVF